LDSPLCKWAGVVIVIVLCGSVARAHEIGTTHVSALLQADGTYRIGVVTDATALLEKLEASAGRPTRPDTDPVGLQSRLAMFDEIFRRRVTVAFDGSDVQPAIDYVVSPQADAAAPPMATIRLTGTIPPGARHFTWTYSWTFTTYALATSAGPSETPLTEWLEGGQTSAPFAVAGVAPESRTSVAWRYFSLGFTHIVPHGLDHVLFVLGIFLLSGRARAVFWQVTAFTVAHSITLALSMYDVIAVSPSLVEPLIALSIAYVALENIFLTELRSWRLALVFTFGLLHGMGFAGALRELGLAPADFLTALLTFNAGVEAGQLMVIAAAFLLVGVHWGARGWYHRRIVVPASVLIACVALYWTAQRLT